MSPLPWPKTEPVRARPAPARSARRRSWRASRGASVAIVRMIEPFSGLATVPGSSSRSARTGPTALPPNRNCAGRPKFASTSVPTVTARPPASTCREAVPMPPFTPKHDMPRPAPTRLPPP